jgi:hypothetical protein
MVALGITVRAAPGDRLEEFKEAIHRHLETPAPTGSEAAHRALSEIYGLVDAEILESLRSGGPFASAPFLQERLEGFSAAWGGALFRVAPIERPGGARALTLGLFSLEGVPQSGSLRMYGWSGGMGGSTPALLGEVTDDGKPELHAWPAGRGGAPRFAVSWAGAGSGDGSRPLRVELWSVEREGPPRRLWSSTTHFPDGLWAVDWEIRLGEILVRRQLRYPGWKPGCPGQSEEELSYRGRTPTGDLVLARHRVINGWHRELGAAAARVFSALTAGDRRALGDLVPDAALRSRLPASLVAEPACDAPAAGGGSTVLVAATAYDGGRAVPWSLTWTRGPRGWRLTAAAPMLQ